MKYEDAKLSAENSKDINFILNEIDKKLLPIYSKLFNQFNTKNDFYNYINANKKFIKIDGISFIKKEYGINNIKKINDQAFVEIWEHHKDSFELSKVIDLSLNKRKIIKEESLLNFSNYVIIDTQTTGIDTSKNKIISIGIVHVENNKIIKKDLFFVNPNLNKEEIIEYTTPQDFSGKSPYSISQIKVPGMAGCTESFITEKDVIREIILSVKNKYIVGHNLNFELKMINALFRRNKVKDHLILDKIIKNPICTLKILKDKYKQRDNSLDGWIKRLNIQAYNRREYHNPLKDSEILFNVINSVDDTMKKK